MIEAYPLQWPANKPRSNNRERARFSIKKTVTSSYGSSYSRNKELTMYEAVNRLLGELDRYTRTGRNFRIPKQSIVISTNIPVKKDGTPYSNFKKPDDPGVAVYFNLDGRPYCLPCDKWDRVEDNIAAIASHVNAMRGIESWGVGEAHDHYVGFKALPENGSNTSYQAWYETLGISQSANAFQIKEAYRAQAKKAHPDAGGSIDDWNKLTKAYEQAINQLQ